MQFDEMGNTRGKTLMLLSAVAFIQDNRFFSSAPQEAREVILQKDKELFYLYRFNCVFGHAP